MSFAETIKLLWRSLNRSAFSHRVETITLASLRTPAPSPRLQVESPLAMDAVLGESAFSVTDDKVSITEMRVHAVSGLTLSLQPSPGNSHTMVAKATALQTLTAPKQVQTATFMRQSIVRKTQMQLRRLCTSPECLHGLENVPRGT